MYKTDRYMSELLSMKNSIMMQRKRESNLYRDNQALGKLWEKIQVEMYYACHISASGQHREIQQKLQS